MRQTHERLKSGANRPGSFAVRPLLGPLVSGLCTLPPRVRCIPVVTLILVKFQFSLSFLEVLQFGTYVPEIK
jgi:hypothetical protein